MRHGPNSDPRLFSLIEPYEAAAWARRLGVSANELRAGMDRQVSGGSGRARAYLATMRPN